jgi:hypothetical protein
VVARPVRTDGLLRSSRGRYLTEYVGPGRPRIDTSLELWQESRDRTARR